ncbi:LuxR C-terminal-related transcriptional regulator [Dietzia psychralcaliphila]|uniref:LuxR C-terminal-related transcriptional regulator n=1 Tax=Dietzia psychralcaliphila TaxID=139021 RepID=UPI000D482F7A|nr:LuxR C-terminal-related transcriptional regulator [Dietzia psychralcaliphila]PTM89616.1 regulatory LuxR family protein [Dietzia psychralcaliphila]
MTATLPFKPTREATRRSPGQPARQAEPRPELSDREVEVLIAWLASDSKREVTERLFLADSTVSTYIQRVRSKYDAVGRPARTKVRLLVRAVEDGYIELDDL